MSSKCWLLNNFLTFRMSSIFWTKLSRSSIKLIQKLMISITRLFFLLLLFLIFEQRLYVLPIIFKQLLLYDVPQLIVTAFLTFLITFLLTKERFVSKINNTVKQIGILMFWHHILLVAHSKLIIFQLSWHIFAPLWPLLLIIVAYLKRQITLPFVNIFHFYCYKIIDAWRVKDQPEK